MGISVTSGPAGSQQRPEHPSRWQQLCRTCLSESTGLEPLWSLQGTWLPGGLHPGLLDRKAPWPGQPMGGARASGLNSGSAVSHGPHWQLSSWLGLPNCHVIPSPSPTPEGPPLPAGWGAGQDAESHTCWARGVTTLSHIWGAGPNRANPVPGSLRQQQEQTQTISAAESRHHLNHLPRLDRGAGSKVSSPGPGQKVAEWGICSLLSPPCQGQRRKAANSPSICLQDPLAPTGDPGPPWY